MGHSLRRLCGLKYFFPMITCQVSVSQPAKAVWIEIKQCALAYAKIGSQPAKAVWIEILACSLSFRLDNVTACEGCVD